MVCALYLSASGDAEVPLEKNTKYYVLTGIVCPVKKSAAFLNASADLLYKYQREKARPTGVTCRDNIFDELNGVRFEDKFQSLLDSYRFEVLAFVVDKKQHLERPCPREPCALTLRKMIIEYQSFLCERRDVGFIFADNCDSHVTRRLIEWFETMRVCFPRDTYERIVDAVFFAPSNTCALLQAAKLYADAIFDAYEYGNSGRFSQLKPKLGSLCLQMVPEITKRKRINFHTLNPRDHPFLYQLEKSDEYARNHNSHWED